MTALLDGAKNVFLFPGVGAQQAGMFAGLCEFPEYRAHFEQASDLCGLDLWKALYAGSSTALKDVRTAQLCLTTATVAVATLLRERCGVVPDFVMGHSLGQLPALCAAGYMDFARTIEIVELRAQVVSEVAGRIDQGEMCWVLHVPSAEVERLLVQARTEDGLELYLSAVDAPDQASISGTMAQIRRFAPRVEALGGLVFPLRIGGPFHSPLMADARQVLAARIDALPVPQCGAVISQLVCNVSGAVLAPSDVRAAVLDQLVSPVRWLEGLRTLSGAGVSAYIELSPKTVLGYLNERAGIPMRPLCAPDALVELINELDGPGPRSLRLVRRVLRLLYSTPLPPLAADAVAQVQDIRRDVSSHLNARSPERADVQALYAAVGRWLDLLDSTDGATTLVERERLRHLYAAALQ